MVYRPGALGIDVVVWRLLIWSIAVFAITIAVGQ